MAEDTRADSQSVQLPPKSDEKQRPTENYFGGGIPDFEGCAVVLCALGFGAAYGVWMVLS